jgi:putative methylase
MQLRKKQLEIFLQKVPDFTNPQASLEQYQTPAVIVADIIYEAFCSEDIMGKEIIDLGCGTGIISFGAYMAHASKVTGVDVDKNCIETAQGFADEHQLSVTFLCQDVSTVDIKGDTVLMNPPFGAQKSNLHADRAFIEKAFEIAPVIYSLHLASTIPFITKRITALKGHISFQKVYKFPLKGVFAFHKKEKMNVEVTLLRILHGAD